MQEAWLSGPVADVDPYLMPAAHALLQARRELAHAAALGTEELWRRPGNAASAGYHLDHIAGSIDRLLTYARGESLAEDQRAILAREGQPGEPPREGAALVAVAQAAIDHALHVIRRTTRDALLQPRAVGRARLPTNVIGLLFHVAEHTQRHAGQLVTTIRVLHSHAAGEQPPP